MKKVLFVVDVENEYIIKESPYFVGDVSVQTIRLNKLISFFRKNNSPIIFIKHIEKDSKKEFKKGKRTDIISNINYLPNKDILIEKNKISSFYKTNLESVLKKIKPKQCYVIGILTNLCVRSLVEDLYDRDYAITVMEDCCIAFTKKTHIFTLEDIKETRPEIEIKKVNEIIK